MTVPDVTAEQIRTEQRGTEDGDKDKILKTSITIVNAEQHLLLTRHVALSGVSGQPEQHQ